ncbi:hypothetical protein NM688_g6671 [Phlebia brevispora]|uniref:Uncharacterized protein n=1 Tax=Phlebia brevispora TaxID=194682 RepID=A0ACC1SDN9_9APHY|nr:hypothetical protein NM688_g6671 [Phlebia brevispora]
MALDEENCPVGREIKPQATMVCGGLRKSPGLSSPRPSKLYTTQVLTAAKGDMAKIQECISAAERHLGHAVRNIRQTSHLLQTALQEHQNTLDAMHSLQEYITGAADISSLPDVLQSLSRKSSMEFPPVKIPSSPRDSQLIFPRPPDSSSPSIISFSSTLIEGDDDDIRRLRHLMTRKTQARLEGAYNAIEKAMIWLRILSRMAPFLPPNAVISGFKERAEALTVQGDKLYIGTSTGNLHLYSVNEEPSEDGNIHSELLETKKNLSRRSIEQLAYVSDISSLAVLSDTLVTLYPIPTFTPPAPLTRAKGALSFALYTHVEHEVFPQSPSSDTKASKARTVPVVVTYLAVGCRRKIVVYSWKDGEPEEPLEVSLPHSPRSMVFLNADTICFGYLPVDYALYSLKTRTTIEITLPTHASAVSSTMGMGALSGLGGYIGLGTKPKPCVIRINEGEALIAKENNGVFVGEDSKPTRSAGIDWSAPPEETAFVQPYIFSILPPGTVPSSQIDGLSSLTSNPTFIPSSVLEIRSSISLLPSQTIPLPFTTSSPSSPPALVNYSARLLTPSASAKSPLYVVSTPTDRATATAEGSSIWCIRMKSWGEQVDELIEAGSYADALALLNSIDQALLPDKESRQRVVRALHAVSQFRSTQYTAAINAFLELNINPAKVVALYPENVSGRLAEPESEWIHLYGGPAPAKVEKSDSTQSILEEATNHSQKADDEHEVTSPTSVISQRPPSPQGSVRGLIRTSLETIRPTVRRDDDTASVKAKKRDFEFRKSIEELIRYLSEWRPKVAGALEVLNITAARSHEMPLLSEASKEDLFALPNAPLSSLTPEQLVRFAQIVDTALFKCYLLVRPGLLAPLCRVGNWCEVAEVEEVLRAREKFSELIYLYNGKRMHAKALDLLKQLSEKETDVRDKLSPSVNYLQRLGREYLDLIFHYSRWVFEQDPDIAFEIFTSEEVELPRNLVADFLEKLDPAICARYVEFLIQERSEESTDFHNRLAELYLNMTISAKKRGDNDARQAMKDKLLTFIDTTDRYETGRIFALLPQDDLFEAKAILLGRMGRHDSALEIYVYRLQDFLKAEEYCKRVYSPDGETKNVFFTLLRIYLRPTVKADVDLLAPALELVSRHSHQLDEVETLNILPPMVSAQDVRKFLISALRAPRFDSRVVKEVSKARDEQVARKLMYLQAKRVKVTDSRICPQCHKRIGHSVIAVHSPRGEVTHYQCREAFSRKLKELRA